MRTIELPVTIEWTPEMLEIHQHRLVREDGEARYAETRVVMLSTLEKENLQS